MLSIGMVGLAGCSGGASDEEAIRASLASELDSIKNIDDAFVNEFSESIDMSQLSVYGIDGVEFMKSYLSGFDYAIDSINVDGDSATAQITLTCKSYKMCIRDSHRGAHGLGQDRRGPNRRRAPRRGSGERRFHADLPGHGHRHGQASRI